jgi:2-aminoadipate transaminase
VALFGMVHYCHDPEMAVKTDPAPSGSEGTALRLAAAPQRVRSSAIREILAITERPDVLSLAGGLPAPDAFPVEALAAAAQAVLAEEPEAALQYAPTPGYAPLRTWVAEHVSTDADVDVDAGADRVVVTHGAQQAIELVLRALVDPGDVVALADPGYVGAIQALRLCGAEPLGIPSDADGLRVDVLAAHVAAGVRPAVVYVVAQLDNPTGATLSLERRRELAHLADRYGFAIVDDDPYGALRWAGEEPAALRTMSDRVVTLGTTSKVLCPGLRVGWAHAPAELAATLVLLKQAVDLQTTTLTQRLAHRVLTAPGFLEPHLARLRATYQARCDALVGALDRHLGDRIEVQRPEGGMFLWGRVPGVDTEALLHRAVQAGVAFVPGTAFAVDGRPTDALRLSFATQSPAELDEAVSRLARALAAPATLATTPSTPSTRTR